VPAGAPDKHVALRALVQASGRSSALFVGDDETDEEVFRQAPADWMTIRVERSGGSWASHYIETQEQVTTLVWLLERLWRKA
jgi:trehalose 6-phosphate phosphatase